MTSSLIELTKVDTVFEAHAIRGLLESYDIPSYLPDEATINVAWFYKHALGDHRINVHECDYERAVEIIKEFTQDHPSEEPEISDMKERKPSPGRNPVRLLLSTLLTIFSGIPTPLKRKKRHETNPRRHL